ncbi:hypothetical protein, partial [Pseudomonas aeruginosa]|uniref:hypothetical protein n=1 Tax=Pseudomonas aeruginosa TaxID=287 RepID=UPI0019D429B1
MPHYLCLTTPFPERWTGREGLAWLPEDEMGDMNPKNGGINEQLPHLFHCLPHCLRPAFGKEKWQGNG